MAADLSSWGKLKCSVCGTEKNASADRVKKYEGKKYVCRACRSKNKEQPTEKVEETKTVEENKEEPTEQ